jgi:hypothetical protein
LENTLSIKECLSLSLFLKSFYWWGAIYVLFLPRSPRSASLHSRKITIFRNAHQASVLVIDPQG